VLGYVREWREPRVSVHSNEVEQFGNIILNKKHKAVLVVEGRDPLSYSIVYNTNTFFFPHMLNILIFENMQQLHDFADTIADKYRKETGYLDVDVIVKRKATIRDSESFTAIVFVHEA
tara:strand:- start:100399 stop:100752 length:354 start_codon:yes stop_codon:yes gene_type:complete